MSPPQVPCQGSSPAIGTCAPKCFGDLRPTTCQICVGPGFHFTVQVLRCYHLLLTNLCLLSKEVAKLPNAWRVNPAIIINEAPAWARLRSFPPSIHDYLILIAVSYEMCCGRDRTRTCNRATLLWESGYSYGDISHMFHARTAFLAFPITRPKIGGEG